ncbi:alcohol dehydrogenase [Desulfobacter hydrogenophilus]|uniref:Alcohol dehydrogenase n=1 Tax=Desulfobacter hydrogenophilus TaxID=2291 RepID=A0A328FEC4_9BACT|nr:iron-containing alcohol dehydrogenase [Desulfobacter hydrogenophilus]NDY70973.1 iron-containing alcohol dehydrogenase [Desulfobacter hydrogenophilus]QBH12787.1 iron-containing alcohol dehydrogenase [Desulfobacter hydrogenophilus]RAM03024.1 alcohol dehydrogenase [Desulfobacter hydrogenophilus]
MKTFKHLTNPVLYSGPQEINRLAGLLDPSTPIFFITGAHFVNTNTWQTLESQLRRAGCKFQRQTVHGEPGPDIVDDLTEQADRLKAGCVVGIGGGSVLDAGKSVAAMLCQEGSVQDYLEDVGTKDPNGKTVPFIALPTTAGTGSEATKNAVLSRPGPDGFKKSFRHDAFIPSTAIIDPELAMGCPPETTLACALDAFSQLLESRVSTASTPLTQALSRQGLRLFTRGSLLFSDNLYQSRAELSLRWDLAMAAYLSGVTLANAGLGTVHGIAGPLGAFTCVPHGVACGCLLPRIFTILTQEMQVEALDEVGAWLSRGIDAIPQPDDFKVALDHMNSWGEQLPKLRDYGVTEHHIDAVVDASGNKHFPIQLSSQQMRDILLGCL